jgi:hypothetical protein
LVTTAPVESVTVPSAVELTAWPNIETEKRRDSTATITTDNPKALDLENPFFMASPWKLDFLTIQTKLLALRSTWTPKRVAAATSAAAKGSSGCRITLVHTAYTHLAPVKREFTIIVT